jgi:RNA-directed DNA polymerase
MNLLKSLFKSTPGERSVADLSKWLAVPEPQLREWLGNTPMWARGYGYSRFTIPKRRGGVRTIEAPDDKLKALQRLILQRLLNPLPLPEAATGFVPGRSIVDNARPHTGMAVVINIDLADFFPTIRASQVEAAWRALGWGAEAARVLTRICTHDEHLPQGAPTSPALSNLVCGRLDARLAALVENREGAYTRYADDLTLSLPGFGRNKRLRPHRLGQVRARPAQKTFVGRQLLTYVKDIIEAEGFAIQMKKKVRVQRAHQRQTATGLVVNQTVNLPRETRRLIRAMQHREKLGRLDAAGLRHLRGLESLAHMVEDQR